MRLGSSSRRGSRSRRVSGIIEDQNTNYQHFGLVIPASMPPLQRGDPWIPKRPGTTPCTLP